jgi:hypothetical protein
MIIDIINDFILLSYPILMIKKQFLCTGVKITKNYNQIKDFKNDYLS